MTYPTMKKNRREFIKLSGLAGIAFATDGTIPRIVQQEKKVNTEYDKKLAAKYDLLIPEPEDQPDPTPDWLKEADMFTADWSVKADMLKSPYSLWKGYDIELKDTLVERIVRLPPLYGKKKVHEQVPIVTDGNFDGTDIRGVSLISHVPHSEKAFKQAHEQGFRVIPYVHFSCIHSYYADQDVFLFQHPEILLKDKAGKWVHLEMDGTYRFYRYLICANNPVYWKLSLAYVKKLMDWGADGIFIDNIGNREECFAPEFTNLNPEFGAYVHEHLFPEASHNYAFNRLLQAIRSMVKSYGNDKIVVLNSGLDSEFQNNGDCCTWESFIYSWAWEGRNKNQTWTNIKESIKKNESFIETGRRITSLSYLDPSRKEVKDDAFWAFCSARLLDVILWTTLKNTGAEQLYQAHMGNSLQPLQEMNQVSFRTFKNGIIVLNDSMENKTIRISLPDAFYHKQLLDLYDGKKQVEVINKYIEVGVPKQSARIFIALNI